MTYKQPTEDSYVTLVLTRTVIDNVAYLIQKSIKSMSLHKGNHPISKNVFIEIVNKGTKADLKTIQSVHRWRCCTYL